jgi:glutamate carboxypeptidase
MAIDVRYEPYLEWLELEKSKMKSQLESWANIPSYTFNQEGIQRFSKILKTEFLKICDDFEVIELPKTYRINSNGEKELLTIQPAMSFRRKSRSGKKIFLGGHLDTVHVDHFPVKMITENKMQGPGVCDMKGGLLILLKALEAFERSPLAGKLAWEVFINADEEIGSPASGTLLKERARMFPVSLWYEPAIDEKYLAGHRKGSINFTLIFKGVGGHAGRDFETGKNALTSATRIIHSLQEQKHPKLDINFGELKSGTAHNVIPDKAILKINARSPDTFALESLIPLTEQLIQIEKERYGIQIEFYKDTIRPPKELPHALFKEIMEVGKGLGLNLDTKDTGGVSDGNLISSVNVPCIDTMGAVGGKIHTPEEWVDVNSLVERSKLSLLYFLEYAGNYEY